ncbi:MAG: GAF domain-containing protein [Thermomicrobiales bacterium]
MISDRDDARAEEHTIALARIVFDLTQRFSDFATTDEMFAAVADGLETLLSYDRLAIVLYRAAGNEIEWLYSRGDDLVFQHGTPVEMSLHDRLLVLKQPMLYPITEEVRFAGDVDRYTQGYRQAAVAPLIIDQENVGLLTLMSKVPDRYGELDLWIVSSLAGALGVMLAGSNLRYEAESRRLEAEFLAEMGLLVSSVPDLNELVRRSVERIATAFAAPTAVYLLEDDRLQVAAVSAPEEFDRQNVNIFVPSIIEFVDNPVSTTLRRNPDDAPLVTTLTEGDPPPMNPVLADELRLRGVQQLLSMPLAWDGRIQGVLGIARIAGKGLSPLIPRQRQPAMLKRLAQYLAPAIQHTLHNEELMRTLNESEVIRRILSDTTTRDDPGDGLDIVIRAAQMLFGADYVAIARLSEEHIHWLKRVGGRMPMDEHGEMPVTHVFPLLRSTLERFAPLVVRDFPVDPPVDPELYPLHRNEGLRSSLVAPFQIDGDTMGILIIGFRRRHRFTPANIRFARSLAGGVAASLMRAHPSR